jgi:2-polyprenyl-3-methyl-5-hydroxy-6-metoxy-1,4-benzoquinol methylase
MESVVFFNTVRYHESMADPHQKRYNTIAKQWQKIRAKQSINQCIVDVVPLIKPQGHILDVGCGTGHPIAAYLVGQGFMVTGIDVAEGMLVYAKQLALQRATFLHADIQSWQSSQTYDAIIAFDSLFHLPMTSQVPVLTKLCQWLNPEGILLFTHGRKTGEITGEMFGTLFSYSSLDQNDYQNLLTSQGLSLHRVETPYQHPSTGSRDLLMVAKKQKL